MCWLRLVAQTIVGSSLVLDCGGVNLGLRRLFNAWAYFVMYKKATILQGTICESSGSEESDAESV